MVTLTCTLEELWVHCRYHNQRESILKRLDNPSMDTPVSLLEFFDKCGLETALFALRAMPKSSKFARHLACDYAERFLPSFESDPFGKDEFLAAIKTARQCANGKSTSQKLKQVFTVVWDLSLKSNINQTPFEVASGASYQNAQTGVYAVSSDAILALGDGEEKWQAQHLRLRLSQL